MSPQGERYLPWTPPHPKDLALLLLTPLLITQLVLGGIVRSSLAHLAPTSYLSVAYSSSFQCSYPSVVKPSVCSNVRQFASQVLAQVDTEHCLHSLQWRKEEQDCGNQPTCD